MFVHFLLPVFHSPNIKNVKQNTVIRFTIQIVFNKNNSIVLATGERSLELYEKIKDIIAVVNAYCKPNETGFKAIKVSIFGIKSDGSMLYVKSIFGFINFLSDMSNMLKMMIM